MGSQPPPKGTQCDSLHAHHAPKSTLATPGDLLLYVNTASPERDNLDCSLDAPQPTFVNKQTSATTLHSPSNATTSEPAPSVNLLQDLSTIPSAASKTCVDPLITTPLELLSYPKREPSSTLLSSPRSPSPQAWVDPLIASPLESTSSSDDWKDPLLALTSRSASSSPQTWVDPLIASPLISTTSSEDWKDPLLASPSGSPLRSPQIWIDPHHSDTDYSRSMTRQQGKSRDPEIAALPSIRAPGIKKGAKLKKDAAWIKDRLEEHMLFQNDGAAYNKYPSFKKQIVEILDQQRLSGVGPMEFEEFQEVLQLYQGDIEDTFLNKILPLIIKESRTVPTVQTETSSQHQLAAAVDENQHAVVKWYRSGLKEIVNREFARTFLSFRDNGSELDKEVIIAMEKEDGVTNPKPDRTFGIAKSNCNIPEAFRMPEEIKCYFEIVPRTYNPFFLIEGKSYHGTIYEARNQACRGGASLVLAARLLRQTLGEPDVKGVDTRTFVFSATLTPSEIEIWVHWADVAGENARTKFHMTRLHSKTWHDEQGFGQTRRIVHNILDWGCGARLVRLNPLHQAIIQYTEKKESEQKVSEGGGPRKKAKIT